MIFERKYVLQGPSRLVAIRYFFLDGAGSVYQRGNGTHTLKLSDNLSTTLDGFLYILEETFISKS